MTANRKKVILIKNFNPNHNEKWCKGCNCEFEKECVCLYLVSDQDPEPGENALLALREAHGVFEKVYVQEVYDGYASIGSGKAVPANILYAIIAEPKQISLTNEEQEKIFRQDGSCEIEMDVYEGDMCGFRVPKIIDNKFIIHI